MATPNDAVETSLERANRLYSSGAGTTLSILKEADANLSQRLHAIIKKQGSKDLKFSEAQALAYRQQIRLVTAYLEKRMLGHTHAQATKAVASGVKSTTTLLKKLEKNFSGISIPLALESQQHQDSLLKGTASSLLSQHVTSVGRYGQALIGDFERVMRVSAVEGLTNSQTISRLVQQGELGGIKAAELHAKEPGYFPKPAGYITRRYWAERIVRTETAYALNAANTATIHRAKVVDFPDMQKKILAHFDMRTAPDSVAVHGQIRPVDGLFQDGAGRQYKHPPARPNDRETVIPWRPHWKELPATNQAPPAVQAEAQLEAAPGLGAASEGQKHVLPSKATLVAMVKKAKAEQKQTSAEAVQATKFQAAQATAQKAQIKGTKLLGAAKLADAAALEKAKALQAAKSAKLPASQAEIKAKAEAYKAKAAALAEQKKAAVEAERAAKLTALAQGTISKIAGDAEAMPHEAGHLVSQFKAIAKNNPVLFKAMQKQAGVQVLHKSPHAAALYLAKKVQPEADFAAFNKKPKAKPVPAPVPAPVPVVPKMPPVTFKEVSGYVDIHDASTGAKLAYMKPAPGGYSVTPPPGLAGFEAKVFATKEEGAPYAIQVSTALQLQKAEAAAAAAKKLAEEQAKQAAYDALTMKEKIAAKAAQLSKPIKMAWSAKWQAPERKPIAFTSRAAVVDRELAKATRAGVSVAADGDFVEDFQISFVKEVVDGNAETVARFRVNEHRAHEVRAAMTKAGDRDGSFPGFFKLKDLTAPTLDLTTKGATMQKVPGISRVRELDLAGAKVRYFVGEQTEGSHPAMKNVVEVRFPDPGKGRWAKFESVAKQLGINTSEPKPGDVEAYKRAKVLSVADKVGALQLGQLKDRTPEAVGKVWGDAVKRDPRLQELADDAELREVAPGQYALYSAKLAERYRAVGITHMKHSLSGGVEVIEQLLATEDGGLLSSRERFQRGLIFTGMSTATDFGTGGADSVFMRLATGGGGSASVEVDHSELGRFDVYAFNSDQYGRAGDGNRGSRMRLSDLEQVQVEGRLSSSNETMLRRTVPRASIRHVEVDTASAKKTLIERLQKRGVTEVNGVPLDELIGF